jgi:hypothetical protein
MSKQSISGLYMLNQTLAPQQGTTFYTKYKNTPSASEVCAITSAFCSSRLFKSLSRPILIALTSDSTFLRVFGKGTK